MDRKDIELIRVLQKEELYLTPDPFQRAAGMLGCDPEELIGRIGDLKKKGIIRRFGAALTPHNAGFNANAMVVWQVEEARENEAAEIMASHPRVSHCYLRDGFEGFPYTLYTMTHANSPEDLERILSELSEKTGVTNRRVLKTLKEFKKSSPVYFPE